MGVRYLNTKQFADTANALKTAIAEYISIKDDVRDTTTNLFINWEGQGRSQFEKDYNIIFRQLSDIEDVLYDLRDTLIEAEATYIKADQALAKEFTM